MSSILLCSTIVCHPKAFLLHQCMYIICLLLDKVSQSINQPVGKQCHNISAYWHFPCCPNFLSHDNLDINLVTKYLHKYHGICILRNKYDLCWLLWCMTDQDNITNCFLSSSWTLSRLVMYISIVVHSYLDWVMLLWWFVIRAVCFVVNEVS